eukprot:s5134_g6.t1
MLSTSCRKKPRVLKEKPKTVSKPQRLLAVARCCRDCGLRLSALEDALHQCSKAFDWPFPAETICSASASSGQCRLVRLGANTLRGTMLSRLTELWETIRETDLSHSLDLPSGERLANGSAWLLMALKGREVLGLLSAERIAGTASACLDSSGLTGMKQKSETDTSKADIGQRTKATEPTLGVAVVWVRRRERRRGLATSLVDCLRRLNRGGSVAFSQPTELGFNFASSYSCRQQHTSEGPLVYDPDWSDESK